MMKFFEQFGGYLTLISRSFSKPEKAQMYSKETFRQARDIGIGSLPIIAIVSTFIGAVSAVQFAYQFRTINLVPMWWIGNIVRKGMILELAPTISALLLAGKVGSNIASEIPKKQTGTIKNRTAHYLEYIIYAGSETLNTFLQVNAPSTSIAQDKPNYSNINGGVGVFACKSRSTITKELWYEFIDEISNNAVTQSLLFNKNHTFICP